MFAAVAAVNVNGRWTRARVGMSEYDPIQHLTNLLDGEMEESRNGLFWHRFVGDHADKYEYRYIHTYIQN
jgi:hypothetical protein